MDKENWEPSPRKRKSDNIHDTSLEVNYSQSAAKVLELIEELKYRLNSRSQSIGFLRKHYEEHNNIPEIEALESMLGEISPDQIATHFDSYMGYIEAALPELVLPEIIKNSCLTYFNKYYQQHGIPPSNKAVSSASEVNNLLLYSEQEVNMLLESSDNKEQVLILSLLDSTEPKNETNKIVTVLEQESELLNKYQTLIFSPMDIKSLSMDERKKIKSIFKSEFRFVKMIKEQRSEADNG